ncbi:hypothetical protein, partial [Thermus sp.]|uniref:hypothetical protein n=1 Tax=Thermus sp. TaxID=275 RepID=UPI0025FA6A58
MSRGLDALTQSWIGGALSGHYPPEKVLACFPPDGAFPPRWRDLAGYIREVVARGRLPSLAELPPEQISLAAEAQRAHFQDAALLDDLYHSILSLWRAEEIRRLAADVGRTAYEGGDLLGALDRLSSFIREGSHTLP